MGAWIEISKIKECKMDAMSLLSWERGLKYIPFSVIRASFTSLLSWERGLKSIGNYVSQYDGNVAPLVGAWIEIL